MENREGVSALDAYQVNWVKLGLNLTAAVFPLMKIYPAEFCIRRAFQEGKLSQHSFVIETSSGTMALALAIVCNSYKTRLTVVTDYACDSVLKRRLEQLGASVHIVSGPAATGSYQHARLQRVREICSENANYWWVNQYDNPCNSAGYSTVAGRLIDAVGKIDCLIGTVGSGGSLCGIAKYLRALLPDLKVIGVDTFNSVLFGQPDGPRKLRGLGNSLMPLNLDHPTFDQVHWVTCAEAYCATRLLHSETTLFRGGTSGAAWLVARHYAALNPLARMVCLFPDDGYRYVETIYNDRYLCEEGLQLAALPAAPRQVFHPMEAGPSWSFMEWDRRSYEDVLRIPSSYAVTNKARAGSRQKDLSLP